MDQPGIPGAGPERPWGDLLNITEAGIARFGAALGHYKQVRDDITRATLRRTGAVGGSPEVYEKIDPATGRGVVSAFASAPWPLHPRHPCPCRRRPLAQRRRDRLHRRAGPSRVGDGF